MYAHIVSWNLLYSKYTKYNSAYHGQGDMQPESPEQTAHRNHLNALAIRALKPDVLLVQEAGLDLDIEHYTSAGVSASVEGRREGCKVLLRSAAAGGMYAELPVRGVGVDLGHGKTAAVATLGAGSREAVTFASVHLAGGKEMTSALKAEQMARVLANVPSEGPCVIAGDFNDTNPESGELGALLAGAGFTRLECAGPTGASSDLKTPLTLDHVFVRALPGTRVASLPFPVQVPSNPWAPEAHVGSDHVPVSFVVSFEAPVAHPSGAGAGAGTGASAVTTEEAILV
jgi:endonuclease/exonuclease/phosphatase family metal-dependent hydrolase